MNTPALIATDLDGTLLAPDGTVSPRNRAALDLARAAGVPVVPVTARNPIGLRALSPQTGFDSWALCGNGGFGIHLGTRDVLFTVEAKAAVLTALADALDARVPGVKYAAIRDAGEGFVAQTGYADLAAESDHKRDPATMGGVDRDLVVGRDSLKLVFRHATVPAARLYDTAAALASAQGLVGFAMTLSGAPFVEVMAEGVNKATGLDRLCAHLGIAPGAVMALGDGLNDVEMLRWAGHGVAVANADARVRGAADAVTASNAKDGFAQAVEAALG